MRWAGLLLLVSLAGAQDAPREDDHDRYGFPIRFDADVITIHDLVRSAGLDSVEQLGNIANERDKLLIEKLNERVCELYGLEIEIREVNDIIAREIARFDSEAEYYEHLAQNGETLELHRKDLERRILAANLNQLIGLGYVAQGRRLLPWDPKPSPAEIRIAFAKEEPLRRGAGSLVRWEEVTVGLNREERQQLTQKRLANLRMTAAEIAAATDEILKPRLDKVKALLEAGKPAREIATELELPIAERAGDRSALPEESPITQFLKEAKSGQQSGLIELAQKRFVIVRVVEIQAAAHRSLSDPEVVTEYFQRIAVHKQSKARAMLQLRALDKSSLRPESVRKGLRTLLLSNLRQAHEELRSLGIH